MLPGPYFWLAKSNATAPCHVDPEYDLMAVVGWIDGEAIDGFVKRLLAAIDQG
jgi:hypothetical protein